MDEALGLIVSRVPLEWKPAESEASRGMERLLTVKACADQARCHEETIRRAYQANQLSVQRFGSRGYRIHFVDLLDWMARGMPTKARSEE